VNPADLTRPLRPVRAAHPEGDLVAVGRVRLQQPAAVVPWLIVGLEAAPVGPGRRCGCESKLHHRAFDAHRQRQPVHQRLRACRVGRDADVRARRST
jgi:hypothetical protein